MTGWIDRMPTWARDLLLMLLAAVLAWAGSDLAPVLSEQPGVVSTLGAPLLVLVVAAITKWTQAYGRGTPTITVGGVTVDQLTPEQLRAAADLRDAERAGGVDRRWPA